MVINFIVYYQLKLVYWIVYWMNNIESFWMWQMVKFLIFLLNYIIIIKLLLNNNADNTILYCKYLIIMLIVII